MYSLSALRSESNSKNKINFDGGDLSLLFTGDLELKKADGVD